jgi:hypothetical protein
LFRSVILLGYRRAGAGAARPYKILWRHDDNRLGADRRILAEPFGRAARPGFLRVIAHQVVQREPAA